MKKFTKLNESEEQEEVELAGKYTFHIFLDIVDEFDNRFVKQNYLNTSDYFYFFTSDKIKQNVDVVDRLSLKNSLKTAYLTLNSIKNARVSFYFGVKNNKLEYGFFDDVKMLVYKVGMFKITPAYLKNLDDHKCVKSLHNIFKNYIPKNLEKIHSVREDYRKFWEQIEGEVEILDEFRIKKSFKTEFFNKEDLDELRMTTTLEHWAKDFSWFKDFYYYCYITEKYVHLYLKVKEKEIRIYDDI